MGMDAPLLGRHMGMGTRLARRLYGWAHLWWDPCTDGHTSSTIPIGMDNLWYDPYGIDTPLARSL